MTPAKFIEPRAFGIAVITWFFAALIHWIWFVKSFQPDAVYEEGRAWPTLVFLIVWLPYWLAALFALTLVWTVLLMLNHQKLKSTVE